MKERPIGPLAAAIRALGGEAEFLGAEGYPPVRVSGTIAGATSGSMQG